MKLDLSAKSVKEWAEDLNCDEMEILYVGEGLEEDDELTPGEVLDIIVDYNGGVASAYEIKGLIGRIYGVWL